MELSIANRIQPCHFHDELDDSFCWEEEEPQIIQSKIESSKMYGNIFTECNCYHGILVLYSNGST
jgi:hypothetical protein